MGMRLAMAVHMGMPFSDMPADFAVKAEQPGNRKTEQSRGCGDYDRSRYAQDTFDGVQHGKHAVLAAVKKIKQRNQAEPVSSEIDAERDTGTHQEASAFFSVSLTHIITCMM
jgi:hypothetical protein